MAHDPRREDYQRLALRFVRTIDPQDPAAAREFTDFGRRFAQERDSLPQTDADRAFHLVCRATELIDYKLPFAEPDQAAELIRHGQSLLDEALSLDEKCFDALRMKSDFAAGSDLQKADIGDEDIENLVIQQMEFCNIILLNKASEVSPEELARIRGILHTLQPHAEIIDCDYGDINLDRILNTHLFDFEKVATSARWIEAVEGDEDDLENEDEGEALEYGIGTFVYCRRKPFDMNKFDYLVTKKWPKSVIRCKGLSWFKDEADICYVFEQAGKQVSLRNAGQWYATMPADELKSFLAQNPKAQRDWDETYGDRMQKLVFIGQDMDREAIERDLDFCLAD